MMPAICLNPQQIQLLHLNFLKIALIERASEADSGSVLVAAFEADLGPFQTKVKVDPVLLVPEVLTRNGDGPDGIEDGIGPDGLHGGSLALPGRVGDGPSTELGIRLATDGQVGRLGGGGQGLVGKLLHVFHVQLDFRSVATETGDCHHRLGGGGLLLETLGGDESCLDTDVGSTGMLAPNPHGETLLGIGESSQTNLAREGRSAAIGLAEDTAASVVGRAVSHGWVLYYYVATVWDMGREAKVLDLVGFNNCFLCEDYLPILIPAKIISCEEAIGRRGQRKGAREIQEKRRKGVEGAVGKTIAE